jgi:hypothetical protein
MSHILPLTAQEVEQRLLKVADIAAELAVHDATIAVDAIVVTIGYSVADGSEVKFRAPVDCSEITRLQVQYIDENKEPASKTFAFADANGNNVSEINNLFSQGSIVKVILDFDVDIDGNGTGAAFVQNADTNAYLEGRFEELADTIENITTEVDESITTVSDAVSNLSTRVGDKAVSEQINDAISLIPTPDVSGQIDAHNNDTNAHSDIRTQLNNTLPLDGSAPMVGDLQMDGHKITGVAEPISGSDVATKSFVENYANEKIYRQNEEPVDAEEGSLWIDLDAEVSTGGETPVSVRIDESLTVSGAAADAKAVGDALANKSDNGHNHDDLYFTASEVDTKINNAVYTEQARAEGIEAGLRTDVDSIKTDVDSIKDNTLYATDINKDGNVELIFGSLMITFTIRDGYGIGAPFNSMGDVLTFKAEPNTTWGSWINSSYCTASNFETAGPELWLSGYPIFDESGTLVTPDTIILANHNYTVSA